MLPVRTMYVSRSRGRGHGLTVRLLGRPRARASRRGQVLLEFAFVSLGFYFLIAGTVELGRAIFGGQVVQNAARVCARELAVMPMPATITFEVALGVAPPQNDDEAAAAARVRAEIYDAGLLVLDVSGLSGQAYEDRLALLPLVNRMLAPLMIRERITIDGAERDVLRYPGAIFSNPAMPSGVAGDLGYLVRIPRVISRDEEGHETIDWVDVIEEVRPSNQAVGPFSIQSTGAHRGIVAVRVSYPFQAALLSGYRQVDGINSPNEADDGAVSSSDFGGPVSFESTSVQAYSGTYGLGSQEVLGKRVRPFRRLLAAQSIFRREVFL